MFNQSCRAGELRRGDNAKNGRSLKRQRHSFHKTDTHHCSHFKVSLFAVGAKMRRFAVMVKPAFCHPNTGPMLIGVPLQRHIQAQALCT